MANINLVQIMGRITRKPEMKTTQGGTSIASLSVATNRVWKNQAGEKQTEAEFHNIVAFGKSAEVICQYFDKGDEIYVMGHLKTNSWETPEGVKKYKTDIILEKFEFGQKTNRQEDYPQHKKEDEINPPF